MDVETVSERMHREEVESLKKRIATLEAEKAERERELGKTIRRILSV